MKKIIDTPKTTMMVRLKSPDRLWQLMEYSGKIRNAHNETWGALFRTKRNKRLKRHSKKITAHIQWLTEAKLGETAMWNITADRAYNHYKREYLLTYRRD